MKTRWTYEEPHVRDVLAESVTALFARFGTVKLVRICSKESKGKLPSWLTVGGWQLGAVGRGCGEGWEWGDSQGLHLKACSCGCRLASALVLEYSGRAVVGPWRSTI